MIVDLASLQDGGDDSAEKYRGGRDMENLAKFINKKLGAEPEEEVSLGGFIYWFGPF